jgi:tetrahydromethanopterin S-methyltransferase subunit G
MKLTELDDYDKLESRLDKIDIRLDKMENSFNARFNQLEARFNRFEYTMWVVAGTMIVQIITTISK